MLYAGPVDRGVSFAVDKAVRDAGGTVVRVRSLEVPLSVLMFIGTSQGELDSIPAEITEKLAAATLKLLRAVSDEPQATLI